MKRRMEDAEAREANLRAKMEEILQCPVCLTVPAGSEVLQCHNGHILCLTCANRINICAVCRVDLRMYVTFYDGPYRVEQKKTLLS